MNLRHAISSLSLAMLVGAAHAATPTADRPTDRLSNSELETQHEIGEAQGVTLPAELADLNWTPEMLASMSQFNDIDTVGFDGFDPVTYPVTQPNSALAGLGVKPYVPRTEVVMPGEDDLTRGFAFLALWPRMTVLYQYSDDIIDIFTDPPDDPDANDLNALSVIPNSAFVFLYINAVTEGRISFIAYDPTVHTGQGFVLLEVNGPLDTCFNVSAFGYQANADEGQLYNYCTWSNFGSLVNGFASTLGMLDEHTRPDRDTYITVFEENIGPPELFGGIGVGRFQKAFQFGNVIGDYDYGSVTHFGVLQSSINGLQTIAVVPSRARAWLDANPVVLDNLETLYNLDPLDADYDEDLIDALESEMGFGAGFSAGDITTIFTLYGNPGDPEPWVFDPLSGCPADVNGDGKMTVIDLIQFLDLLNQGSIYADLNFDGVFDANDFSVFYASWRPGFCLVPGKPKPPNDRPIVGGAPG